jgi:hypothetical protein
VIPTAVALPIPCNSPRTDSTRVSELVDDVDRDGQLRQVELPHLGTTAARANLLRGLRELARHRITVNSVAPGLVATAMTNMEDVDVETVDRPKIPAGRPADAREIASAIGWLCSDGASYTTGVSLVVDGGFLLTNPSYDPAEA